MKRLNEAALTEMEEVLSIDVEDSRHMTAETVGRAKQTLALITEVRRLRAALDATNAIVAETTRQRDEAEERELAWQSAVTSEREAHDHLRTAAHAVSVHDDEWPCGSRTPRLDLQRSAMMEIAARKAIEARQASERVSELLRDR